MNIFFDIIFLIKNILLIFLTFSVKKHIQENPKKMKKNKIFKSIKLLKITNKSDLKPRNELKLKTFSNTNIFSNTKKLDIYKQIYPDLIGGKIKYPELQKAKSKFKKVRKNSNNKLSYKLNSFLDNSSVNKDSKILYQYNKLKYKILKNKNHSYFSPDNEFDYKNDIYQNNSFLEYKSFEKYPKNKIINDKNNFNNNITLLLNKYSKENIDENTLTNINSGQNNINLSSGKTYSINCKSKEKYLETENSKLKNELKNSNNELEKYKKYKVLYLNLVKKLKNDKGIKEQYINELIERGNEINNILKEDKILENNIKDILTNIE